MLRPGLKALFNRVRTQAYYDSLGKELEHGMITYNSRTGKTILSNSQYTAVFDGKLPSAPVLGYRGRLRLPDDTGKYTVPGSRQQMLFEFPNAESSIQQDIMSRLVSFVDAKNPDRFKNLFKRSNSGFNIVT